MPFINKTAAREHLKSVQDLNLNVNSAPVNNGTLDTYKRIDINTKAMIGTIAVLDGKREAAKAFDVTDATAHACAAGFNLPAIARRTEIEGLGDRVKSNVENFRKRIAELSSSKIMTALENISEEKITNIEDAQKLANLAATIAKVQSGLPGSLQAGNAVQINIYRPRTKDEEKYEVVEVHED
jgi:hypothetical protein